MPDDGEPAPNRGGIALKRLLNPLSISTSPEDYLKGAGEFLALLFCVCWTVTAIENPDVIKENAIMRRIGYNNMCVGFDTGTARKIGLVLCIPATYFVLQYCWTDIRRTAHSKDELSKGAKIFYYTTDILFAVSICVFALVFVIEAKEDTLWGHSLAFLQFVFVRWLVVAANYHENWNRVNKGSKIFLAVYTVVSLMFPLLLIIDYIAYDNEKDKNPDKVPDVFLPWWLPAFFDYAWFLCLPLTTKFLPPAGRLVMEEYRVVRSQEPPQRTGVVPL